MNAQQVASIRRQQEKMAAFPPPLPPPDYPPEGIHHEVQPSDPAPTGLTDEPDGELDQEEKPKEPEVLIGFKLCWISVYMCIIMIKYIYIYIYINTSIYLHIHTTLPFNQETNWCVQT